jgi:predicted NAD-dependent protein-ADP-ribosyltransferase YbiA (DUF1768 family)
VVGDAKKMKRWCTLEHYLMMKQLEICDTRSKSDAVRRRCYQAAARKVGRLSKKCV